LRKPPLDGLNHSAQRIKFCKVILCCAFHLAG
jgi:hypothetical protein